MDESGSCFRSCVFRIRYCFEEVRLQTALLSRIYVTSLQASETTGDGGRWGWQMGVGMPYIGASEKIRMLEVQGGDIPGVRG